MTLPPQSPAGSLGPIYSFPLKVVAKADEQVTRRSEGTLVELRDGSVLFAYASHKGRTDNDRAPLVCKCLNAEGEPITSERVLVPPPDGGLNAISPALRRLPDGRIGLLFSYRIGAREASRRFLSSADEGETWSDPVIVGEGGYRTGCHDRLTVHSSGRLLAPLHCQSEADAYYLHVRVSVSDDHGKTWQVGEPIELPKVDWPQGWSKNPESGCLEPGIAERADKSLLMTIRTAMGTQFCSESFDRGITWSEPHSMEVISPLAPANLSRIPGTDDLLLVWTPGYSGKLLLSGRRHTIMACVSRDGGKSWPHTARKILVHDPEHSTDYPSLMYKGDEAWITLRVSTGEGILQGLTSTCLMRVPLAWFYGNMPQ